MNLKLVVATPCSEMPLCSRHLPNPAHGRLEGKVNAKVQLEWVTRSVRRHTLKQKGPAKSRNTRILASTHTHTHKKTSVNIESNWQSANYFSLHYTFKQESKVNLAKPVENMSGLSFAPESNQINILLKESEAYFRTIMSFYIVTSTFCKAICNNKKKNYHSNENHYWE